MSLCMLSTTSGGAAEVRASGPRVWSLLEGVAWAGSLSQERGDRLFWTKRESPRLEELCLLAASAFRGGGGQEELSQSCRWARGSQCTPLWHWAPSSKFWVPAMDGRGQPGQVFSLPRPQAGGCAGPPSFLPPRLSVADRQVWAGGLLSQFARNVLAAPSYTLPLPAPTSPSSPGAACPRPARARNAPSCRACLDQLPSAAKPTPHPLAPPMTPADP